MAQEQRRVIVASIPIRGHKILRIFSFLCYDNEVNRGVKFHLIYTHTQHEILPEFGEEYKSLHENGAS